MGARLLRVNILSPLTGARFDRFFAVDYESSSFTVGQTAIDARLDVVEGQSFEL